MTSATRACPFVPLCEREFTGPDLDDAERQRLEAHLSSGCATCEEVFEEHLAGSDPEAPGSDARRELDDALARSLGRAADAMAEGRERVLRGLDERLAREAYLAASRQRRRHLRAVFYLTSLAACALIVVAYFGTVAAVRLQQRTARTLAVRTELEALVRALTRHVKDHGRVPEDLPALVRALGAARPDGDGVPYYPFDPARLRDGGYVDDFGRPYVYRPGKDRAQLYSLGADGKDDGGQPDDLEASVFFVMDG